MSHPKLAMKFMSLKEIEAIRSTFPHIVTNRIGFNCAEWRDMVDWLNTHVGNYEQEWNWERTDQVRFKTQSHALNFSLTWT